MFEELLGLGSRTRDRLPSWRETVDYLRDRAAPAAVDVLRAADRPVLQPRCGVGDHRQMLALLRHLDTRAAPGLLSVTVDSHTRLRHFGTAARVLREDPGQLNGYPLVAHGWARGRELGEAVAVPLEVRHGSPDARELFAFSMASGITSFEGGGIGYNLPYAKDVPLETSLAAWQRVDAACAALAAEGVVVERELFGTLTAVLVPPSVSLAVTVLEAALAAEQGVRCLSVAYPQGGEIHQDVAALRAVRLVSERYLPRGTEVFPVLHAFMGVFPRDRAKADALLFHGALTGRLGGAVKVITKTRDEAWGIPSAAVNALGLTMSAVATSPLLDFIVLDEDRVEQETEWILAEVAELVEPLLAAPNLRAAVCAAFAAGTLDIPFSASLHARSAVLPCRDAAGAIRYLSPGGLPFSARTLERNRKSLADRRQVADRTVTDVVADINHFAGAIPAMTSEASPR